MLMLRRHALSRDNPEPAGEIKFAPFRATQLAGADEQQGNQPESAFHRKITVMPFKAQHNLTELSGVERGGPVSCLFGA